MRRVVLLAALAITVDLHCGGPRRPGPDLQLPFPLASFKGIQTRNEPPCARLGCSCGSGSISRFRRRSSPNSALPCEVWLVSGSLSRR